MRWRTWITESPMALRLDRWLAWTGAVAASVAALLIVTTYLTDKPVAGAGLLLAPGILLVVFGQLWSIGILNVRLPQPTGSWWARWNAQLSTRNPRKILFGALPNWASYGLIVAIVLAWLAGFTSILSLSQGDPTSGRPGCPWPLDNHGAITCVSHTTYEQAGAAEQRAAAGVLMFFFIWHSGLAANELLRNRPAS